MSTDLEEVLNPTDESKGEERPRDEKGRWVREDATPEPVQAEPEQVEEPQAQPEVEEKPEKPREDAFKTAMMEERRKRQELEARLKAYEEAKKLPDPPPFWDDPEKAIEERISRATSTLQQDYMNRYYNALEANARSRHADYDEVRDVFIEQAQRNPVLAAQMNQSPDPAEYAYQQGRMFKELSTVGNDFDAYRKRLEAEIRQKLEAELKPKAQVPRSLNAEPSSPVSGGQWEPTSLESLMGHKF